MYEFYEDTISLPSIRKQEKVKNLSPVKQKEFQNRNKIRYRLF